MELGVGAGGMLPRRVDSESAKLNRANSLSSQQESALEGNIQCYNSYNKRKILRE